MTQFTTFSFFQIFEHTINIPGPKNRFASLISSTYGKSPKIEKINVLNVLAMLDNPCTR